MDDLTDEQTSRWILLSQFCYDLNLQTTGNPRKNKDKKNKEPASKTCETPRREEGATARACEAEESSTSQVKDPQSMQVMIDGDDGVEMTIVRPSNSVSRSQTNRMSRSQPSTADIQCFMT